MELHREHPGVDGFMIGRGVFANPYCFTEYLATREELMELLKLHLALFQEYADKHIPYEPLKHFFKIYINNFPGAAEMRAKLMETHSVEEAYEVLRELGEL